MRLSKSTWLFAVGLLLCVSILLWAQAPVRPAPYKYTLSSGPFGLPANAQSVDWVLVNDTGTAQTVRVTVYKCAVGVQKTAVAPGALTETLNPGITTHNANSVGTVFQVGFPYEVIIETNDKRILPNVQIWQDHGGTEIPGTLIPAGDFVDISSALH